MNTQKMKVSGTSTFFFLLVSKYTLQSFSDIEEILREKATYFATLKKKRDFCVTVDPLLFTVDPSISEIFHNTLFYKLENASCFERLRLSSKFSSSFNFNRDYTNSRFVAITSTDPKFIDWLALRVGSFEKLIYNFNGGIFEYIKWLDPLYNREDGSNYTGIKGEVTGTPSQLETLFSTRKD